VEVGEHAGACGVVSASGRGPADARLADVGARQDRSRANADSMAARCSAMVSSSTLPRRRGGPGGIGLPGGRTWGTPGHLVADQNSRLLGCAGLRLIEDNPGTRRREGPVRWPHGGPASGSRRGGGGGACGRPRRCPANVARSDGRQRPGNPARPLDAGGSPNRRGRRNRRRPECSSPTPGATSPRRARSVPTTRSRRAAAVPAPPCPSEAPRPGQHRVSHDPCLPGLRPLTERP